MADQPSLPTPRIPRLGAGSLSSGYASDAASVSIVGTDGRSDAPPVAGGRFRDVLGRFPTGVTVVTSAGPHGWHAVTVNSFASLSLQPPLVLVCLSSQGRSTGLITANGVFAVNILSERQVGLARRFARSERGGGRAAFADVAYRERATGCPVLAGVAGFVDCAVAATHQAGDHTIIVGQVRALGADESVRPLVFHRGRYASLPG